MIIGCEDGTLRLWSLSERKILKSFRGHELGVSCVATSACGRRVVSGSEDKTVRVWDVETGTQVGGALTGHTEGVISVAISEGGRRAVSGSSDKSVRVWDVNAGKQIGGALTGHTGWVVSVGMSADGRRVVSRSSDKSVRVWDVERGITLHNGREEDWEDITDRFVRTADLGTVSHTGQTREIFSRGETIVQRREDGSEAVLAQLECPADAQIYHDHGVVVAEVGYLVAIMKLVV